MLAAALQTLVSAFSRSYREAQTYLSILMLVPLLLSVLLTVLPVKTAEWMYAVPLLGQQIAITELLVGGSVTAMRIGMCLVSGFAVAAVLLVITGRVSRSQHRRDGMDRPVRAESVTHVSEPLPM